MSGIIHENLAVERVGLRAGRELAGVLDKAATISRKLKLRDVLAQLFAGKLRLIYCPHQVVVPVLLREVDVCADRSDDLVDLPIFRQIGRKLDGDRIECCLIAPPLMVPGCFTLHWSVAAR